MPWPSSGSSWFHRPADRTARAGSEGRWPARPRPASVCRRARLHAPIGASTLPYPRIHEMSLVQLPPSMLNRLSPALSSPMTAASRSGPSPGSKRSHTRCWNSGCKGGRSSRLIPRPASTSRYSVTFATGVSDPEHSLTTPRYLGKLVHHDAAVLAVGDLGDQRRDPPTGQFNGPQARPPMAAVPSEREFDTKAPRLSWLSPRPTSPSRCGTERALGSGSLHVRLAMTPS